MTPSRGTGGRHDSQERVRIQAVIDAMDDGIFMVGGDFRIELMNLAVRAELGEGEGRLCHELFHHDPSFCSQCQHEMGSFGPVLRREWHSEATGRAYEMVVSPAHKPDGSISRLHILRDISDRKRLEAQLIEYSRDLEARVEEQAEQLLRKERLALLGEISAGLAHEVRTPLGAIITGIKLLEKGEQSSDEREMIFGLLKRETARLDARLSEFLTYARDRPARLAPVDVAWLLEEAGAILRTDSQLLGSATIETKAQPGLPPWPLDVDLMKEVLLNLCVNALQAMKGHGTIRLEAKAHGLSQTAPPPSSSSPHTSPILEILVRDNGPGIPLEVLPHVFKPFYTRRSAGSGLGLATCREIVESHGGRIAVTSFPNRGATFRITVPFSRSMPPPAQSPPSALD